MFLNIVIDTVTNNTEYSHFNKPGHKIEHFNIQVLESINTSDAMYRKNRESLWIQKFDLKRKGMNGKA